MSDKPPRIIGTREIINQISIFIPSSPQKKGNDSVSVSSNLTSPSQIPYQSYARAARKVANQPISNATSPNHPKATTESNNFSQTSIQYSNLSLRIDEILKPIDVHNLEMTVNQSLLND